MVKIILLNVLLVIRIHVANVTITTKLIKYVKKENTFVCLLC